MTNKTQKNNEIPKNKIQSDKTFSNYKANRGAVIKRRALMEKYLYKVINKIVEQPPWTFF